MNRITIGIALIASLMVSWLGSADCADLREVVKIGVGVNGYWADGPAVAFPSDFELGGNAAASLSPHLSAVSSVYYGFQHSYVRWSVGARITATDVNNPNFSVGLGTQYVGASETELLPEEWTADCSFGWRVMPETFPRLSVVGLAGYGFTSSRGRAILGARYQIPL